MTPDMAKIIWLVSYPKSGNTWFRAFHANLIRNAPQPVDINQIFETDLATSRYTLDQYAGLEISDLSPDEIETCRPRIYETMNRLADAPILLKVHDAFIHTKSGAPVFPAHLTRCVLYLVRNPLDVAVSFAHHNNCSIDEMIEIMGNESYNLLGNPRRIVYQVRQPLSSWSGHVKSWLEAMPEMLHLVRYEDMLARPVETFTRAVNFAGLPDDPERIERAIRFSSFKELKNQEASKGFRERSQSAESFFRKGKAGSWREVLNERQVDRIIQTHQAMMQTLGYLDEQGRPVY